MEKKKTVGVFLFIMEEQLGVMFLVEVTPLGPVD